MTRFMTFISTFTCLFILGCNPPTDNADVETTNKPTPENLGQEETMEETSSPPVDETPAVALPDDLDEDVYIPEGKVTKVEEMGELIVIEVECNAKFNDLLVEIQKQLTAKGWTHVSDARSPFAGAYEAKKESLSYEAVVDGKTHPGKSLVTISLTTAEE